MTRRMSRGYPIVVRPRQHHILCDRRPFAVEDGRRIGEPGSRREDRSPVAMDGDVVFGTGAGAEQQCAFVIPALVEGLGDVGGTPASTPSLRWDRNPRALKAPFRIPSIRRFLKNAVSLTKLRPMTVRCLEDLLAPPALDENSRYFHVEADFGSA